MTKNSLSPCAILTADGNKKQDLSEKHAFDFIDGLVEGCVLYLSYRIVPHVICISSQIGCSYSCKICCNGRTAFKRNLSIGEMEEQVEFFLGKDKALLSNPFDITLMGVGEPLENIENVIQFADLAFSRWSQVNKLNISTIGIISGIERLMSFSLEEKLHLQVSLHGSSDEKRREILGHGLDPVEDLIGIAQDFGMRMNDTICYNYVMIRDVNDSPQDIIALAHLLKNKKAYLKLSELNRIDNGIYEPSEKAKIIKAKILLEEHNIRVKLFGSTGKEKNLGCGQLSSRFRKATGKRIVYKDLLI